MTKIRARATTKGLMAGGVVAAVALATGGVAAAEVGHNVTQAERTKAVRAAGRAVPRARVLEVHREREHRRGMICVELRRGSYVYDVDLNRQFKVVEVEREYDD